MEQVLIEKPQGGSTQHSKNYDSKVKVLCFDISHLSQTIQFIICCSAVFFFYIIYGYMQVNIARVNQCDIHSMT